MVDRPLATVGGLIIADDGDLFLVRSKKWKDLYSLPGGKVEWGERLEDAFQREVREETGLEITDIRFAFVQECIASPEFWQPRHFVMNDFIAKLDSSCAKTTVVLNDEAYEFIWVQPKEALNLPLHRECRVLIEWYLSHNPFRKPRLGVIGFEHHHVRCKIGVYPHERTQEQDLYFDVKAEIDFATPAATDNVQDTLDYTQLTDLCTKVAQEGGYQLLETLACTIMNRIFALFKVRWVKIRIKKPAAIPSAEYAVIEIEERKEG
ncbi:putative dGTP pyrophosphohydrolase/dihydroneopterin aldolase [Candidatus Protochlamydia naegleriophila]|uniref:Putative dGTP pyrophosphohydrolase/dihydroneopterin aldolase n=1 Tax=Candidatus Protochlamydia naegleriophila TaxID=389348 RepID=A0A0U5EQB3_9BACT|nr:dihydroneopterin aldolase [Candidatus Protochlamydia naegleriophila]CUI16336.1 putative dGTP pyrophosphohydrolase/dihydroneopterin aldolase [Candidatus Protochlamydia naegleriophila]